MGITVEDYMRAVARGVRAGLKKVIMYEPQTGPWANDNVWGDRKLAPLPATAGQVVQVLAKNAKLYGPPAVHSIGLGRSDEVNAGNADVRARITYGCGGVQNEFFCDWVHGVQLSLVCNAVSVDAVSYAPGEIAYDASTATVFLAAMVAKGTVAQGRCPATFTYQRKAIATPSAPGANSYDVPDFAREFALNLFVGSTPNSNPATAQSVFIYFVSKGGVVLAKYDAQVCAGGRSIPIPGGCNQVQIENAAAATAFVTPVFFLGL